MANYAYLLLTTGAAILAFLRLRRFLHIFQQEEYDNRRFFRWLLQKRAFDRKLSAGLLAAFVVLFLTQSPPQCVAWIAFAFAILQIFMEPNPQKHAKKTLAMTARAKRILGSAFFLGVAVAIVGLSYFTYGMPSFYLMIGVLIWLQILPLWLIVANYGLKPVEAKVQKKFWVSAHQKLKQLSPVVVGITGSYGKTSVKHILAHILNAYAPTLATPGSVNTVMGIARIIREQLNENHRYFIAEMGAYGPGSIKRLCDFCPPQIGVITAVGLAHHERFKTLANVARAKFELAEAAENNGGKVVFREALSAYEPAQKNRDTSWRYGPEESDAPFYLKITEQKQTAKGLSFVVTLRQRGHDEISYEVHAPLYGLHHIENIVAALGVVAALGLSLDVAVAALKNVAQIKHRLEVKESPQGPMTIDDAYNSNPEGFAAALGLLDLLGTERHGRRILITPGMVELGKQHDVQHARLGEKAAQLADIVLVIRPERIESFVRGFEEKAESGKQLIKLARFSEAQEWIAANALPQDVILIENDLPDLFEEDFRL